MRNRMTTYVESKLKQHPGKPVPETCDDMPSGCGTVRRISIERLIDQIEWVVQSTDERLDQALTSIYGPAPECDKSKEECLGIISRLERILSTAHSARCRTDSVCESLVGE